MSKLEDIVNKLAYEIGKLEIIETYCAEITADKVNEVRESLSILSVELQNIADELEGEKENGNNEQNSPS